MGDEPGDVGTASEGPVDKAAPLTGVDLTLVGPPQATEQFTAFYRDYMPRLVRFLVLDGAPVALAAELAQEVMVSLWRNWDTVQYPKAWARTAAARAWIRYRTQVPELPTDIVPDPSPLISTQDARAVEVHHDLLRLLTLLAPRERQVMALTYDDDTPAEIASELGIAEATVRSIQRNARQKMAVHRPSRREGEDER